MLYTIYSLAIDSYEHTPPPHLSTKIPFDRYLNLFVNERTSNERMTNNENLTSVLLCYRKRKSVFLLHTARKRKAKIEIKFCCYWYRKTKDEMAKEKIGISFSARAETDLIFKPKMKVAPFFFYGRSNGHWERGMKSKIELHFRVVSRSSKSVGTKIHALQRSIVVFNYYILISCSVRNKQGI